MNVLPPANPALVYMTVSATQASTQDTALGGRSVEVSIDGVNFSQALILTFDPATNTGTDAWGRTQKVWVRAIGDSAAEGERTALVSHSVSSTNTDFNQLSVANVQARVIDNDLAGLLIRQTSGSTVVLEGDTVGDSYSI